MSQSHVVHPNIQLTDVTEQFRNAAGRLQSGQLIKDEHFTLFEAVGALEIGDPKMDSGCLEISEDMDDGFNPLAPLTGNQVIWLMDELFCREAAWHGGYPLSQTLFTSVHLDKLLWPDPKSLVDARFSRDNNTQSGLLHDVLRSYCLGLVKCCGLVLTMVTGQHYYEEEDFATQLFNRELLSRFTVSDILEIMRKDGDALEASIEHNDVKDALIQRLHYRCAMLELLQLNTMATTITYSEMNETVGLLNKIQQNTPRGEPLEKAFSIKIQRRLASSVPPRPMIVLSRTEAFDFFRQFMTDATTIFELFDITHSGDLFTGFSTFVSQVPQSSVYVRAVLQSFLTVDDKVLGRYLLKEFIEDDMRLLVLPSSLLLDPKNAIVEAPSDKRFQISSCLDQFIAKVGQSFLNLYRTFCLNRCRIRRTLCHAAIEWDSLQADIEELDAQLQPLVDEQPQAYPSGEATTYSFPLSSWVYHYKLIQLRLVVQLGFELSIYARHEFPHMYWYLGYICGTHLAHLERISFFVTSTSSLNLPNSNKSSASQKKEVDRALRCLYRHFTWLKATEALSKALHNIYSVLQRRGHFVKVDPAYASDGLRYELRMRPFQHLSLPEPLSFREVQRLSDIGQASDAAVLDQAAQYCTTAKKSWEEILKSSWHGESLLSPDRSDDHDGSQSSTTSIVEKEWTKDVRNCMKACIGTSIFVSTLQRSLQGSDPNQLANSMESMNIMIPIPEDKERFHKWWAVPKIVK